MDNQTEVTKPKRLKFSRLCLSQNHKSSDASAGASSVRASTQASNSQISRFFKHSKAIDGTQEQIEPISLPTTSAESNDSSNDTAAAATMQMNCDNDEQPLCNVDGQAYGSKRKHRSKCDNKTDTKSTIKSFFVNELNDSSSDFEVPKKIAKKLPKVLPTKVAKNSRSRRKQQPDIRKALNKEDATACNDYSHLPEAAQLELALALSKAESMNASAPVTATSSKPIDLNAFAFNSTNSKSSNTNSEPLSFFNVNGKTKNRFKWNSKCTPLTRRNEDAQKMKIRDKIDEILLNNIIVESSQTDQLKACDENEAIHYTSHQIHSRHLQRICISERVLFELNNCDSSTNSTRNAYYTNNLVEVSDRGAESLLKDWSKIPGRDAIYDGRQKSTNHFNETDTVRSSSPEYDILETESNSTDNQIDNFTIVTDGQHDFDAAGCSQTTVAKHIDGDDDDGDRTMIMDSSDIQSKIDAINANIRLGQQFCDNFLASDSTVQASDDVIRAPSPDLFDDDDDDEYCAENDVPIETNDEKPQDFATDNDETSCSDTVPAVSGDVIVISSSEGTTKECNTDPAVDEGVLQRLENQQNSENAIGETIELLDSDSENMLVSRIESSPHVQLSQSDRKSEEYSLPDMKTLDDDFQSLMQSIGRVLPERPTKVERLNKSNETGTEFKKLSFTERMALYEKDMLNGFTDDIPFGILEQSQQQLSQESIDLSDDEVNYSMHNGAKHQSANDDSENEESSPFKLDLSDSNSNSNQLDAEQTLINRSVCNILEKTFEQCASPVQVNRKKPSKSKTLKKFQSDMVLTTRYEHTSNTPTTSSTNHRVPTTPNKKASQFESSPKQLTTQCSPISQRSIEGARMDLSNDDYYIRIGSISPKPNYELMDAVALESELRKYGLKPSLSRRQAVICLDYIYNRTHPFMDSAEGDIYNSLKSSKYNSSSTTQLNAVNDAMDTGTNDPMEGGSKHPQINFNVGFAAHNLANEKLKTREVNRIFLPSMPRAKKPWCLEPLHIAWHNLITANSDLRKAVLLYEPINLVELKKFFKTIDMTFDNRDLIAFLDLHCITFRMNKASKD